MTNATQWASLVIRIYRVGGIFYNDKVMLLGKRHNSIHITGYASIVYHDDDFGLLIDERFYLFCCHVRVVATTIGKAHISFFAQEGNGGRNKSIRGHDDLIARL